MQAEKNEIFWKTTKEVVKDQNRDLAYNILFLGSIH
jgi:hypothetical protein